MGSHVKLKDWKIYIMIMSMLPTLIYTHNSISSKIYSGFFCKYRKFDSKKVIEI